MTLISRIEEVDLTSQEIDVMKHALGWPKMYRNFFAAGDDDQSTWLCLIGRGLAYETANPLSPDRMFHVTDAGKALLRALERSQ